MNTLAPLTATNLRPTYSDQLANRKAMPDQQALLQNKLAERLGLEPGALAGKSADFSPEKVAGRIIDFIQGRLELEAASGADTSKLQDLLAQARQGVEQGFAEAKKVLDGLGVLKGKVASDVDDTYQRIQDGLAGLDKQFAAPAEVPPAVAMAGYQERFVAQAQSFDMQVTTRDGDRLKISIAQASASYSQSSIQGSIDGQGSSVKVSRQSSSMQIGAFQVSVEGQLDEQERAALEKLFTQVQDLSGKFYAGDLSGAFDRAMALQLDGEQLASMSLHLTQTRVRQAADAYSAVAQQGGQAASAVNGSLQDYAQGLLEALRSAQQLADNARSTLDDLLKGGFSLDERFDARRLGKAQSFNSRLLDGLQSLLQPAMAEQAEAA